MPAQLMAMNGPSAFLEHRWRARTTSSLPVPLSPVRSTELSEGPTRSIVSVSFRNARLSPMRSGSACSAPSWTSRFKRVTSLQRAR